MVVGGRGVLAHLGPLLSTRALGSWEGPEIIPQAPVATVGGMSSRTMSERADARDELLEELCLLEVELHQQATRHDAARLRQLLHPDFVEVGRSGTRYVRDQMITALLAETASPTVEAGEFELLEIGDGVMLLLYVSGHRTVSGELVRRTRRSSLWTRGEAWQMLFHQGTPFDG